MGNIERETIPLMDDKIKFHGEMLHINTIRIENIEAKLEQLNKILTKNNTDSFDISAIQRMDEKL